MSLKTYIKKNRKRLRKRKRLIAFLSILAILGLSTATFAWFTVNTFAGVNDFELKISTGEELRVSMQNHGSDIDQYVFEITNEMMNQHLRKYDTSLDKMILYPVTTNNGSRFTYQYGTEAKPNDDASYLEIECYFIATKEMWVHLTTETGEENSNKEGTRVSSSSSAPKSEITQAIRIDFQTEDSSDGVKTWEPNKGASVTRLTTFDLPSGEMKYSDENNLFHLEKLTPKKVTFRLWMEGEDPQCDNDVQDANLSVRMSFVGCDDKNNPIS
ncbi:MAG: hypothetical protein IJT79_04030 [Ruminococcus sp.]|nr:hypothetical protein [Ruminococcus sp.]